MNLDYNQLEAVRAKEKNILVVAAPGSGKTTVIINRVKYLVDELKVFPSNIIVITFTKMAGVNMKNRYINSFKKRESPFFGTFHGLFYKMLLREGEKIQIVEGYKVHKLVESILKKYQDEVNEDKIKEALNNISLFKTSMMDFNEFNPSISKEIFKEILEGYNSFKSENNLWDFDDLTLKVLDLLKNNKKFLEGYRRLFKYILVDEFQDCDNLQIQFLKLINGEENHLFCVGDEDQCIYSFRGAKPHYMVTFNNEFKGSKKYYLDINYRSNKNIVEYSKGVIDFNKERNNKTIIPNKNSLGNVFSFKVSDERQQGDELSKIITSSLDKYNYGDNAILYRTNAEGITLVDSFIRNKIPFKILDKEYNFFNHFICKDILSYLHLAINPYDRESFIKIINKPFRYISKNQLSYLKDYKFEKDSFDILFEKKDAQEFQKIKFKEVQREFNYIKKASLSSAIQYILSDMGYLGYLKDYISKYGGSFDDFEGVVEEFKLSASSYKTILQFFDHVDEVSKKLSESKQSTSEDRVLLSTIHGVKGMEFKNVFLVNAVEDTLPHSSSKEENIEEERRLFYVGVTRAIENLYIYVPKFRKGNIKEPSRFVKEGEGRLNINKSSFKEGKCVIHTQYGEGIIKELNEDSVKILFDDGNIRKFSLSVVVQNGIVKGIE